MKRWSMQCRDVRFRLAFCEASGACLIRCSGTDEAMIALATRNAQAISARPHVHHLSG